MSETDTASGLSAAPKWQPLSARQRRVLGTLIEKSKTTPESYPLTLLALTTGCNQKSNRSPVNNYSQDQIEETVDFLKSVGAVTTVHGNGRVPKVRHQAYQWMGVSKVEAAIMAELLLRGEQTVGELRTRASRMEEIPDLAQLGEWLETLHSRDLVVYLTPRGRGQVVTHNLYQEQEKAALLAQFPDHQTGPSDSTEDLELSSEHTPAHTREKAPPTADSRWAEVQAELETLRQRIKFLEDQLDVRWEPES